MTKRAFIALMILAIIFACCVQNPPSSSTTTTMPDEYNFGRTEVGSQSDTWVHRMISQKIEVTEPIVAKNITVSLRYYKAATNLKFYLYDEDGNLMSSSSQWTLISGWDDWKTLNITPVTLDVGNYWIGVWGGTEALVYYFDDSTSAESAVDYAYYDGNVPTKHSFGANTNQHLSMYLSGDKATGTTTTTSTTTSDIITTTSTQQSLPEAEYVGFMKLKEGQWIDYSLGNGLTEKMYYIGEDDFGGKKALGLEVQLRNSSGYLGAFQLWVEPKGGELIKYVGRINGKILCMDGGNATKLFANIPSIGKTPDKYLPENAVGYRYINLLSGTRVYCAEFRINKTVVLASSEVPFGIVRAMDENIILLDLTWYGTGMQRTISKKEADDCVPISGA